MARHWNLGGCRHQCCLGSSTDMVMGSGQCDLGGHCQ